MMKSFQHFTHHIIPRIRPSSKGGLHFVRGEPCLEYRVASASVLRGGEPALYDGSGQRRVADSAAFGQLFESLEVILVEPQRDLLGARGSNLHVEVLELVAEFLDSVTTPELALGSITLETRKLAFFINHPRPPRRTRARP